MTRARVVAQLLAVALAWTATPACASSRLRTAAPLMDALEVVDIVVEPTVLGGAEAAGREWFQALVSSQASAAARRSVVEGSLAKVIVAPRSDRGVAYRLTGRLAIPVALPSEYRGSGAAFKKGTLATARFELLDAGGEVVGVAESSVRWRDVRWTTGSAKTRKAKNPELALLDAAELAVQRALRHLVVNLRAAETAL